MKKVKIMSLTEWFYKTKTKYSFEEYIKYVRSVSIKTIKNNGSNRRN